MGKVEGFLIKGFYKDGVEDRWGGRVRKMFVLRMKKY